MTDAHLRVLIEEAGALTHQAEERALAAEQRVAALEAALREIAEFPATEPWRLTAKTMKEIARAALASAPAPAPERDGWRPITKELKGGPYLVTNNVTAVNAHGVMSHVWVGHIIKASNPELTGKYVTYDQSDGLIHNLTHYMPLPAPPRGTPR